MLNIIFTFKNIKHLCKIIKTRMKNELQNCLFLVLCLQFYKQFLFFVCELFVKIFVAWYFFFCYIFPCLFPIKYLFTMKRNIELSRIEGEKERDRLQMALSVFLLNYLLWASTSESQATKKQHLNKIVKLKELIMKIFLELFFYTFPFFILNINQKWNHFLMLTFAP